MYSELMEDTIAGIRSEEENLELVRFLSICSEGIGDTETYCEYFSRALGDENRKSDPVAVRVKNTADRCLDDFIKERKKRRNAESGRQDDGPPPGMDEFEYIDWVITH